MNGNYKAPFKQFVKKAHKPLRLAIEDEVDIICGNPAIGEAKKGDLSSFLALYTTKNLSTGSHSCLESHYLGILFVGHHHVRET